MSANNTAAIGFKGRMMTLTVLEISSLDLAVIGDALAVHVQKSPDFFRNMPVLLSLPNASIDLTALVALIRRHNLVPVALSNPTPELADAAGRAGLGVISSIGSASTAPSSSGEARERPQAPAETPTRQPESQRQSAPQAAPARMITSPVRSGQQIYARDTDLIVTAAVSEGAEVIADGNIHIYGALRGRALAGASGDRRTRIFCRRFEAELVAVAGCYKVADDMQESVRGKAVQVSLNGDQLLMDLQE